MEGSSAIKVTIVKKDEPQSSYHSYFKDVRPLDSGTISTTTTTDTSTTTTTDTSTTSTTDTSTTSKYLVYY
ncbi:unnamed protein product [Rotaria sp. Silwood1]|nr:unnamed protein product [Rotaria sp. Silwood1]CAF4849268.1 unnamed protein product [Rotaria sp. Silwood1]